MTEEPGTAVLPYSCIVGQEQLKTALELSYIAPRIGGVLATGDRGTAKSMTVRAFSIMMNRSLPVTLPINATDDRVLGGWRLDELVRGRAVEQRGLLEEAGEKGVLYVDEINLLDDHVVNIILDVSSTGILTIQREGVDRQVNVEFTLVGTMNPDEGGLRPQLLDRFGLSVDVRAETDPARRRKILDTVLRFDEARARPDDPFLTSGMIGDSNVRTTLTEARGRLYDVKFEYDMTSLCAELAAVFGVSGHRGDVVTALAARALAAREDVPVVTRSHVRAVAPLALQHRRSQAGQRGPVHWTAEDQQRLDELTG
ncbi:magnesium chelatase subunit I [Lentzea albidocapillata subsp. violacea]|uniref:Magnesium chelatase subunit I n=1 Tax=Lentzea albidocapillata subsp. violacea TaxID=128104 RepID=A0A1G8SG97_9PSEU|nr:AAA family ATPase [Lentzea albidocapillata]SDJ28262.1 magnesium chelatase subunit I [Lentzea albidocapillata subsp. violacea]